jgi:hypothetical protein
MPQWAKYWKSLEEIQQPEKRGNHFMGFLAFVPRLAQPVSSMSTTRSLSGSS